MDKILGHSANIGDKFLTLFMCAILLTGTAAIISLPSTPIANAAGSAAVNLDQCKNGGVGKTPIPECNWVNGNLNEQGSHYTEGDSVAYRAVFSGMASTPGTTLDIEWDTTDSGHNAEDFITGVNRTQTAVDPLGGLTGYPTTFDTFTIPSPQDGYGPGTAQPKAAFDLLPSEDKLVRIYGGTITGITYLTQDPLTGASQQSSAQITFTPTSDKVVIAWGGHIAKGSDWAGNSASSLHGSPYHMRLLNMSQKDPGNQDRSLSVSAITGKLTIIKDTVPNDPQDFTFNSSCLEFDKGGQKACTSIANFILDDDSDSTHSNTAIFTGVGSGNYTITELANLNYVITIVCVDPSNDGTNVNNSTGKADIRLAPGDDITCTFVNTPQIPPESLGQINLIKVWDDNNTGSSITASDFALSIQNDTSTFSGTSPFGQTLTNGIYTIYENSTLPSTTYITNSTWGCVNTGSSAVFDVANNTSFTLNANDNIDCTIVNTAVSPHLTLIKIWDDKNSGSSVTANDFDLFANDTATSSVLSGKTGTSGIVPVGTFDLSENTILSSNIFDAGTWSCDNSIGPVTSVTLSLGDNVTCTITNTANLPHLTLVKNWVDVYGSTVTANDFRLNATNSTGDLILSGQGTVDDDVNVGVYDLTEDTTLPDVAYTKGTWSCVDAQQNPVDSTDAKVSLNLGDDITCTITNTAVAPHLTLVKNWDEENDYGSTVTAGNFTLTAKNSTADTVLNGQGTVNGDVNVDTYTLDEDTALPNQAYTAGTWSCVDKNNGDATVTVDSNNAISVDLGQDVECTIVNTPVQPHLKLIKDWPEDADFGSIITDSDFTLNATNSTGDIVVSGSGTTPREAVNVDTYTLDEDTALPDNAYSGTWNCVDKNNGDTKVDVTGNDVSVDLGQDVECTIANTPVQPQLALTKIVINNNNGQLNATQFQLNATGDGGFDGHGISQQSDDLKATLGPFGVNVTTYTLSEENKAGYKAGSWSCIDKNNNNAVVTVNSNNQITIGLGQNVECTITNDDINYFMTGGGSVFNGTTSVRTTHGFELKCDPLGKPNNLEINWHKTTDKSTKDDKKFKLTSLSKELCGTDQTGLDPRPPVAGFNMYYGEGNGTYTGLKANEVYNIRFMFTDYGEPGTKDVADYIVFNSTSGKIIQQVGSSLLGPLQPTFNGTHYFFNPAPSGQNLQEGNHQAHGK